LACSGIGTIKLFAKARQLYAAPFSLPKLFAMPNQTFTTAAAATELGVSVRRVQALIASGRLAAEKHGRDWIIESQALDAVRERKPGKPPKASAS
jgi:excisionase family DNA binding protein